PNRTPRGSSRLCNMRCSRMPGGSPDNRFVREPVAIESRRILASRSRPVAMKTDSSVRMPRCNNSWPVATCGVNGMSITMAPTAIDFFRVRDSCQLVARRMGSSALQQSALFGGESLRRHHDGAIGPFLVGPLDEHGGRGNDATPAWVGAAHVLLELRRTPVLR